MRLFAVLKQLTIGDLSTKVRRNSTLSADIKHHLIPLLSTLLNWRVVFLSLADLGTQGITPLSWPSPALYHCSTIELAGLLGVHRRTT